MSVFSSKEIEYLGSQKLGRLATVGGDRNPHVVPVGFLYNPETDTIDIGGRNIAASKKWRDASDHPRVAFVVDDVLPPWKPRFIEIRGDIELLSSGGEKIFAHFAPDVMRLRPVQVISWGLGEGELNRKVAPPHE